ncbi:MAG: CAP domain-containing protein [Deltaproteobacteria bacterium]|nr:CAP domain-containing protein [Deltaproteobacteria bacterium]
MRGTLVAGLCLGLLPGLAAGQEAPSPGLDAEERAFLDLLNQYRRDNGLGELVATLTLNTAADRHAFDMASNDWFDHTGSDGSSPSDRCAWAGYPGGCGENLAAGYQTARDAFEGWRSSPGHNANMLESDYAAVGVALEVAEGTTYTWYWATDFGFVVDGAGCACTDGETRECASACGPGAETCASCAWSACDAPAPTAETCNGLDDDCNGVADDAPECAPPPEPEDEGEAGTGSEDGSGDGSQAGSESDPEPGAPAGPGFGADPDEPDELALDPGWGSDPDGWSGGSSPEVGLTAGCGASPGQPRTCELVIALAALLGVFAMRRAR